LKCQWCHQGIEFKDCGKSCPSVIGEHRPDNRHAPLGKRCPCGRAFEDHRVGHKSKGDPCAACGLPAASHIPPRRPADRKKTLQALRERDGWSCAICKEAFDDPPPSHPHPKSVNIDHLSPVWKGGAEELSNLRLAHYVCNMKRGGVDKSPAQLARDQAALEAWKARMTSGPRIAALLRPVAKKRGASKP
jgi:hypothetical protein